MTDEEQLTPEDIEAVRQIAGVSGLYPESEEKRNVFAFFNQVMLQPDNLKTANLDKDELGSAILPVRTRLELALFCRKARMKGFAELFEQEAQITLASSLSKEAKLIELAVTQKREAKTQFKKGSAGLAKRGWFAPKPQPEGM